MYPQTGKITPAPKEEAFAFAMNFELLAGATHLTAIGGTDGQETPNAKPIAILTVKTQ
jgi:hypothetical protein